MAGKADAGIAGITVTPEREKNIGFTDSYADVRQVIMVNSENAEVAGAYTLSGHADFKLHWCNWCGINGGVA